MTTTTASATVTQLKGTFSHHGIPSTILTDNGPQFTASEFPDFASEYGLVHHTSSRLFTQGNGFAERMVHTVKRLLIQADDTYLALLMYRTTPLTRVPVFTSPAANEPKPPDNHSGRGRVSNTSDHRSRLSPTAGQRSQRPPNAQLQCPPRRSTGPTTATKHPSIST